MIVELVVYKVKDATLIDTRRREIYGLIAARPGFREWQCYQDATDPARRVDHVLWDSLAEAKAAGDAMMADPAFKPFMEVIDAVESFGHFSAVPTR
jgi:heme-degrading monooxygenase HmoA